MVTYQFSRDNRGNLLATRQSPAHSDTKGLFIEIREGGYGATGIAQDWNLPSVARWPTHFEYFNGDTREYHRIAVADFVLGGNTPEPPPLEVRHSAWPGMDATEIRVQLLARRNRAIAKAIERAKQAKAYAEEQARLKAEEERLRTEIATEMESEMSEADAIAAALRDAGLEEWA